MEKVIKDHTESREYHLNKLAQHRKRIEELTDKRAVALDMVNSLEGQIEQEQIDLQDAQLDLENFVQQTAKEE